jgi:hypothetical protein
MYEIINESPWQIQVAKITPEIPIPNGLAKRMDNGIL